MAEAKPDRSVPNRGTVAGVRLIAKCRLYQASQQASLLNSSSLSSLYFPLIAMSAPVETVPAPVAAEAPKVTDDTTKDEPAPATEEPVVDSAPEAKAEPEPAAEATAEATDAPAADATEPAPAEPAPESPKPKSPAGLFSKLLAPFKGEKKAKAPKSPKKEKKKEEAEPVAEDAPKEEAPKEDAPAAEAEATEPAVVEAVAEPAPAIVEPAESAEPAAAPEEPVKETTEEAPAPAEAAKPEQNNKVEEKKADEKKKAGRRLSARVTGFFRPKHKPEETSPLPAKVDENPPKIDEPAPVAPLENPTADAAEAKPADEPAPATEDAPKPAPQSLDATYFTAIAPSPTMSKNQVDQDEDVLQAVILADSFNTKFEPLSVDTPRVLLPVCNAPLLDWTFECLASAGVVQVFVFCRAHVEQIREAIEASQWSKPGSAMSITTIVSREAQSVGDAMRELDAKQILTSDFVLLTGDVVSNIKLDEVIKKHKQRRKVSKDAIMTCVVKEVGKAHRTKPVAEKNVFVLDAVTNECVYYEYQQGHPPKQRFSFSREIFDKHPDVDVRTDLMDCSIDICSVDVPVLFTENFDYQDLRKDFMHGVLTSDILGKTMHCHIAQGGYGARVRDTRSYAAVSKDIISRWSFPLVPDNNHPAGHTYDYRAGNRYIAKPANLSRTSRIGKNTMIGPSTMVEDDAFIVNSVLGARCEIGTGSTISGSYIWDNVHVGSGCEVVESIVAAGVKLEKGVKLARGCIVARGVVLGQGTQLPPFSRVSSTQPEGVDEWAGREQVELGPGSIAWVWPNDTHRTSVDRESDEEDEEETFENIRLGRLADACSGIDVYDSDEASTLASESDEISDASPPMSGAPSPTSSTSELPGLPLLDSAADFQSECTQSLKRAFDEEHTVENAAIELKTLRMASNVPLPQVREAVVVFTIQKLAEQEAGRPEVKAMFARWGALLKQIGGYDEAETLLMFQKACCRAPERSRLFPAVLTELYQNELIEEEGLTEWFMNPLSKGANSRLNSDLHATYDQLRVIGGQLLQQLRAQESESEEESEE
ncbi:Translation initiation factor eIF-2B epsilon subunit [Ceratobasidium theobromae]|uniref:Translation initiation factor eIF2B subunit epsilon n=1 Tax=Ceratobasidium theobromae TaxID=1582974 RepID=A0A5N5R154_9AGAM|nr:Translation initiation factor eIF-2B epsilon subunit [Ceratobasidium theobromae]